MLEHWAHDATWRTGKDVTEHMDLNTNEGKVNKEQMRLIWGRKEQRQEVLSRTRHLRIETLTGNKISKFETITVLLLLSKTSYFAAQTSPLRSQCYFMLFSFIIDKPCVALTYFYSMRQQIQWFISSKHVLNLLAAESSTLIYFWA